MANGVNALAALGSISPPASLGTGQFRPASGQNALVRGQQSRLADLRLSEAERARDEAILDDLTASVLGSTDEASFNAARDAFARRRNIPVEQFRNITFADLPNLRAEAIGARNVLQALQQAEARRTQPLTPAQERQFAIQEEANRIRAAAAGVTPRTEPQVAGGAGVVPATTGQPAPTAGAGLQRIPGETPAAFAKRVGQRTALQEGGQIVLQAVDDLSADIGGRTISGATPEQVAEERRRGEFFERATGPFRAGEGEGISLQSALEGAVQTGRELAAAALPFGLGEGTRKELAFLDRIRQDTEALRSTLQRELLKGQGTVSESERASINRILGSIATARNAADAQASLNNFRRIVRNIFRMGPASTPAGGATPNRRRRQTVPRRGTVQAAPALTTPGPQPSAFAIQQLRANPTDANMESFNRTFGGGAAERVLGVQ